jgi:tetratricopeptide (TPR) repeat protein
MHPTRLLIPLILGAALLAGCDTAEERAEAHHRRATELVAEGKIAQAIVEFRNVFKLDGANAAARLDYANLMVAQGNLEEAIGQFLRLVEQDWGNVAGHKRLAELALEVQDLATAETHANRAYELDPKDPEIRAYKATVDYAAGRHAAAVKLAEGVLGEAPGNLPAQMVLIADRMRSGDDAGALERIETALAGAPEDESLHLVRLAVLERQGDRAAVGAELEAMTRLFPENDSVAQALIQWHMQGGDIDAAEPLLRARAAAAAEGSPERTAADLALVQALYQTRGAGAARAELDRLAAASPDAIPYARARAGLEVSEGDTAAGIAGLEAIIDGSTPSDERRDTQVMLAQILGQSGDAAGAGALIDAVLLEDSTHVGALKLSARRAIDGDRPEAAIRDLRTALNQEPRDSETLTLMAMAHERAGAHELAGEQLALAVEVSGKGAAESVRYARFLGDDGRLDPAAGVIAEALRQHPQDPDLLAALGRIRLIAMPAGAPWRSCASSSGSGSSTNPSLWPSISASRSWSPG